MKPKTMILMVVAVACGLVASYMTSRLLADRNTAPAENNVTVVVAKKKVPQLTVIRKPEDLFELQQVPEGPMTAKAVKSLEELQGKRVKNAIKEGDFIRVDDLQKKDELVIDVPKGQRAIAIQVNAKATGGGFILPGMRVDVICTMRGSEASSSIILQNMLVLAIDQAPVRGEGQTSIVGQTATLAATPDECKHLLLAASQGELCLALRSQDDVRPVTTTPTRLADLTHAPRDRGSDGNVIEGDTTDSTPPVVVPPTTTPEPPPQPVVEPKPVVEPTPQPEEPKREQFTLKVIQGRQEERYTFQKDLETGAWFGGGHASADDDAAPPPSKPKQEPKNPAPSKDGAKSKG